MARTSPARGRNLERANEEDRKTMEISGKAAVVVGGASGMAKATAEMLVREGTQVSLLDLPASAASAFA